jgi:hypothetical protein
VRVEQVSAVLSQDQTALVMTEVNGLDEALLAEMIECVVVDVEIVFGHDPEGADGRQGAAVLAVQLADAVPINDQLAILAAR